MRDGIRYIPQSVTRILNKAIIAGGEEQLELIRLSRNGDKVALEKLTLANVKFVVSRVLKFVEKWDLSEFDYEEAFSDLVDAGMEGMYRALKTFDESYGAGFLTYARNYIDKYIRKTLEDEYARMSVGGITTVSLDDEIDDEGTPLHSIVADDGPLTGSSGFVLFKWVNKKFKHSKRRQTCGPVLRPFLAKSGFC